MSSMSSLEEEALSILSEVCKAPREQLTAEKHLIRDFDLDSVVTLDLLIALEEKLGLEVSEVEAARLVTVGDILDFVRRRGGDGALAAGGHE